MHEAENINPKETSNFQTRFHSTLNSKRSSSSKKTRSIASSSLTTSSAKNKSKSEAQEYLKPRPKTDFYLLFALALLFMTMVFMG